MDSSQKHIDVPSEAEPSTLREQLWHRLRIHRERGVAKLVDSAAQDPSEAWQVFEASFEDAGNDDVPWERTHGGLMATSKFALKGLLDDDKIRILAKHATCLLIHEEPRIREESGLALGALASVEGGPDVYEEFCREPILFGIGSNLVRNESETEKEKVLLEKFSKAQNYSFFTSKPPGAKKGLSAKEIFHESAGWKTLETSSRALLAVTKAQGTAFRKHITADLLGLIYHSLGHTNRFVRETAYYVCSEFTIALQGNQDGLGIDLSEFNVTMCSALGKGLADNWSQVRMAASVACRRFLLAHSESDREQFFPTLLPRLALNRYYVAEGVRLYNQESWKVIFGDNGKELVENYMGDVVKYYSESAGAANHAVREAACACIAELGLKASKESVQPFVTDLLKVLLVCFKDQSWPVRDASCIASGRFLKCFADEGREMLPEFIQLYIDHMCDNIWSVRQNAAEAIGSIVDAYGDEVTPRVFDTLTELLPSAKDQAESSQRNTGLQNVTLFGVAAPKLMSTSQDSNVVAIGGPDYQPIDRNRIVQESEDGGPRRIIYKFGDDDPLHTNQQLYSCGSLAPKLQKGGCMDCDYERPQEPWEKTDGCVYLMMELATRHPDTVEKHLPVLAQMADLKDFKHHFSLLETIWKQLPYIARGIGKKPFKRHIESFIPSLHYSLVCQNQLARAAAEDCVVALSKFVGPNILKGRVEIVDPSYCDAFDRAQVTATHGFAVMERHPGIGVGMPQGVNLDSTMPRGMPSFASAH